LNSAFRYTQNCESQSLWECGSTPNSALTSHLICDGFPNRLDLETTLTIRYFIIGSRSWDARRG